MRCCFPNRTTQKPNHSLTLLETFWKGDSSKAVLFLLIEEHFKMASFCVELLQSSSSNIRENELQTIPPEHFSTVEFLLILIGVMIEFFIEFQFCRMFGILKEYEVLFLLSFWVDFEFLIMDALVYVNIDQNTH